MYMPPSIYIHKWLIEIQCQSHSSLTRSSKIGQCVFFASSESHIWEVIHLFLLGTTSLSVLPIPPTCFCCCWHRSLASATAVTHSFLRLHCTFIPWTIQDTQQSKSSLFGCTLFSWFLYTNSKRHYSFSYLFYAFPSRWYGCLYDFL